MPYVKNASYLNGTNPNQVGGKILNPTRRINVLSSYSLGRYPNQRGGLNSCGYYLHGLDAGLPRQGKLGALLRLKQQEALLEHSKRGALYRKPGKNNNLSIFFF